MAAGPAAAKGLSSSELDVEKRPAANASATADRTRTPVNEKATSGSNSKEETLPGWTIMRPLRMRRIGKDTAAGSKTRTTANVASANGSVDGGEELGEIEALRDINSNEDLLDSEGMPRATMSTTNTRLTSDGNNSDDSSSRNEEYKTYKRRWFGLIQLVLLNIIVSWDWLSFSANSTTCATYYNVTPSSINWLSTAFLFSFVVISPLVVYTLHRGGPKPSIITASVLILLGNWIRYGATRAGPHGNFGGVMLGQIFTGLAQPFVLAAPTRYSDLWFTNHGRVAATAVMSLANPFGGALAQLVDPLWASSPEQVPMMVLWVTIIATVAAIPSFFIPAEPPTPCSPSNETPKESLGKSLKTLFTLPEFYMIMLPFVFLVALFNSISSIINQVLQPYGFTETEAGISGALLIVVGLVASAITSPIIDKTKSYLFAIKLQVPIIAICYLAFTWAPETRSVAAPYAILSIMGSASFSLVPIALEYVIELTHPVSPEVTSTICWAGGQLLGGVFILVSGQLRAPGPSDGSADDGTSLPPGNMWRALIFHTVMAMVVVPPPLALGCCGRRTTVRMRRVEADKEASERRDLENGVETLPPTNL
jgi:hypothetical protein